MFFQPPTRFGLFKNRRQRLIERIKEQYGVSRGIIFIAAGFEVGRHPFRQESSFYYLTGVCEPAAVLCLFLDGQEILYIPRFSTARSQWLNVSVAGPQDAGRLEFTDVRFLGKESAGYSFRPQFTMDKYEALLHDLDKYINPAVKIFTLHDELDETCFMQVMLYKNLQQWLPALGANIDVSPVLHELRRAKDEYEIDLIYKAVQITNLAHRAAADMIKPGKYEYEVKAALECVFTGVAGASPSFPSIVATGKNTTVLHYTQHDQQLKEDDLIVVDIGAEYGYYAADLTRTYPVGGTFSPRQREIYQLVLDTQQYIESIAVPGMYLRNDKAPEKSLRLLAIKYLDERGGYGKYFCHGIGHYLGLEVHDVGDYNVPLKAGDVFTIEPGIYIPEEGIGVRIEDDYVMADDGAACLSYELPKEIDEIEAWMQQGA
ncbi:M24 family metallopeptidase [bacterium]|nr:M24 family metallopeptidase [bacterium]